MKIGGPIIILAGLAGLWVLLSGHISVLLLGLGVLSCLFSYFFYSRVKKNSNHVKLKLNPFKQVPYVLWLIVQILKANFEVIIAILNPKKLSPEIFKVQTGDLDETAQVIYANSITLTPGTVSTKVDLQEIQVHGLLTSSKEGLLDNRMLKKVQRLTASNQI